MTDEDATWRVGDLRGDWEAAADAETRLHVVAGERAVRRRLWQGDAVAFADAAQQAWPPFVLVCGLLLIGVVAHADGLFERAGSLLERLPGGCGGWGDGRGVRSHGGVGISAASAFAGPHTPCP